MCLAGRRNNSFYAKVQLVPEIRSGGLVLVSMIVVEPSYVLTFVLTLPRSGIWNPLPGPIFWCTLFHPLYYPKVGLFSVTNGSIGGFVCVACVCFLGLFGGMASFRSIDKGFLPLESHYSIVWSVIFNRNGVLPVPSVLYVVWICSRCNKACSSFDPKAKHQKVE